MATMRQILARVRRHREIFDLTRNGLGDRLLNVAADGVLDTIAAQTDPAGAAWAPLGRRYEDEKSMSHPGRPMAIRDFLMAQPQEVHGTKSVTTDEAIVQYGLTQEAQDEAEWFQNGGGVGNRPPRPFWGFTSRSIARSTQILTTVFKAGV